MKRNIFFILICWCIAISISFVWNYFNLKRRNELLILKTARSFFDFIVLTRRWNALHGGVYVPISTFTPPNPYLEDPLKIIEVNEYLVLTKVNPAYMTRQLSELAQKEEGVQFRITSLKPISPENWPTPLEKEALEAFEKGKKEFSRMLGQKFFYMAPLITEKSCLKCHAKQGYKEGDIRGGISIILPFRFHVPLGALIIGHAAVAILGIVAIIYWSRKLEIAYKTIEYQATHDALTGIYNRREFENRLSSEFRRCKRHSLPLSLIMCDIDSFKKYNDTYGHKQGDECLKQVAQEIKNSIRRAGDFCARYGGEEFAVILPGTPAQGALHVAENIRKNIENLNLKHQKSPHGKVTLSLGVATLENFDQKSPEDLIKRADNALYLAKKKGRNRTEAYHNLLNEKI